MIWIHRFRGPWNVGPVEDFLEICLMSGYIESYFWCLETSLCDMIWLHIIMFPYLTTVQVFCLLISFNNSSVEETLFFAMTHGSSDRNIFRYFVASFGSNMNLSQKICRNSCRGKPKSHDFVTDSMVLEIQRQSSSAIWVTPFPQTFWLVSCASAEAPILCSASFGITHRLCLQVWWIFVFLEVMTTTFKEGYQSIHMERHYKTSGKHAQSSNCKHPNSLDQKKTTVSPVAVCFGRHVSQCFGSQQSSYGITFVQLTTNL